MKQEPAVERTKTPLSGRLALRPAEAAEYLGVGLSQFNIWVNEFGCPKAISGNSMTLYERIEVEALWDRVKEARRKSA